MSTSTPSCLLCGSPCKEHAFVIQSNDDDPDSVLEDIQRLDRTIDRLRILKTQRYRQLNALRSLTRNLPNEILLYIFHSFFPPEYFPHFILGMVCSHWRNLINSDPRFWRSLDLTVNSRTISRSISLLEVFKKRNGASFEFLQLDFQLVHNQTDPYHRLWSSLRGVSTLSRIAVENPPADLIQIINDDVTPYDVCLSGSEYVIDGPLPQFPVPSVPWLALTKLALHRIQVNICCELLLGCPNLIAFSNYNSVSPANDSTLPGTHHTRETHFPCLQQLTWHHEYSAWDDTLLSLYRFPALQRFCWHGDSSYSLQLFHDFTSLLPLSCRTFHLAAPEEHGGWLKTEILQQITHPIEQLVCSDFHRDDLLVALERLQDPTFIPSLAFFRWEYLDRYYLDRMDHLMINEFMEFAQPFKDAFRSRKEIGSGRFRMEVEGMKLEDEISKESICELMGGGFDLEIAEDGCWIISF